MKTIEKKLTLHLIMHSIAKIQFLLRNGTHSYECQSEPFGCCLQLHVKPTWLGLLIVPTSVRSTLVLGRDGFHCLPTQANNNWISEDTAKQSHSTNEQGKSLTCSCKLHPKGSDVHSTWMALILKLNFNFVIWCIETCTDHSFSIYSINSEFKMSNGVDFIELFKLFKTLQTPVGSYNI